MPFCTSCGTRNEDTAVNCAACQAPLRQGTAAVPPAPPVAPQPQPVAPVPPPAPYVPPAPVAPMPPPYVPPVPQHPDSGVTPPPPAPQRPDSGVTPPPPAPQRPDSGSMPPQHPDSGVTPRYAVLSTGAIWGSIFFMNIPIIGWIACLVWAFSQKCNLNRRNLARATLIFIIIQIICWWGAYYMISTAVNMMLGAVQTMTDTLSGSVIGEFAGIGETLNGLAGMGESLNGLGGIGETLNSLAGMGETLQELLSFIQSLPI